MKIYIQLRITLDGVIVYVKSCQEKDSSPHNWRMYLYAIPSMPPTQCRIPFFVENDDYYIFIFYYIYKYVAALQFFRLFVLVFHCILTLPHSIYTFNFRMLPKHYQVSYIEKITMT